MNTLTHALYFYSSKHCYIMLHPEGLRIMIMMRFQVNGDISAGLIYLCTCIYVYLLTSNETAVIIGMGFSSLTFLLCLLLRYFCLMGPYKCLILINCFPFSRQKRSWIMLASTNKTVSVGYTRKSPVTEMEKGISCIHWQHWSF